MIIKKLNIIAGVIFILIIISVAILNMYFNFTNNSKEISIKYATEIILNYRMKVEERIDELNNKEYLNDEEREEKIKLQEEKRKINNIIEGDDNDNEKIKLSEKIKQSQNK